MPLNVLLGAIVTPRLMKSTYEAPATPPIYAAVGFLKRANEVGVYDRALYLQPVTISELVAASPPLS